MVSNNLKKDKIERAIQKRKQSDLVVNKLMVVFLLTVAAVCGMMIAKRNIDTEASFLSYVLPVLLVISGVLFALSVVNLAMSRSRHVDESRKVITSLNLCGAAAVFFLGCAVYRLSFEATWVIFGVIGAAVLYFVYMIFRKDFFIYSLVTALGVVFVKLASFNPYSTLGGLVKIAALVMTFAVPVAAIILALLLTAGKGSLTLGDKQYKLLEKGDHVYPIFIASALTLAGAVLAIAASTAAIYAIIALLVAYLAIIVAYTIKMM
ncbi:MAG: hypothetical protein IJ493_00565 [Clostridia bacterium]|nr:hypothetical protein [Clostridia bacterium]